MPEIVMYSKSWCPFCDRAKHLLTEKGSAGKFDQAALDLWRNDRRDPRFDCAGPHDLDQQVGWLDLVRHHRDRPQRFGVNNRSDDRDQYDDGDDTTDQAGHAILTRCGRGVPLVNDHGVVCILGAAARPTRTHRSGRLVPAVLGNHRETAVLQPGQAW